MKPALLALLFGHLVIAASACGSSPDYSSGGGGQGGEDATTTGSGGSGGGMDTMCAQACSHVAEVVMGAGCGFESGDCTCVPGCGDELEALAACIEQAVEQCSCNEADELDCPNTLCDAESGAYDDCAQ